jgi:(p)ppGpp synthase/HD superfamily hydrolase
MWSSERYVTALRFAAARHAGQKVPGSELPYLVHVVSVTAELTSVLPHEAVGDPDLAVQCALLHDTLEDTETSLDDLVRSFGAEVAAGVQALTKNAELPKSERMADSLRRIRLRPREVWLVKLADRITNLAPAPPSWSGEKRLAYLAEAREIQAALAEASPLLGARLAARMATYLG